MIHYKVLTMWEPWATLLIGREKFIETRPSQTKHLWPYGIYLIHSAKKFEQWQRDLCKTGPFFESLSRISDRLRIGVNPGHIIGAINIIRCDRMVAKWDYYTHKDERVFQIEGMGNIENLFGDYREGRYAWLSDNPQVLKTPIPYVNGQGYYQNFKGDESQLIFK